MSNKWWKEAVIYQIYPRSFKDSNNDGIGDIKGIIDKLYYLSDLGIDAIWLSPVCQSPQDDNGYDISNYQVIDSLFGNLEDMELLIKEAGKKNIKIIMDLVLNHTSDEHTWFQEAKKGKMNPYHDYYVWRDGEEGIYPNDLVSCFSGPAWEWCEECQQYYLHQFSVKQPDLNWECEALRKEIYDMINWWIDKGVGGFRLDVIDLVGKEPDSKKMAEGTRLHEFIKELSAETFGKTDLVTVGETWSATPETAKLYSNPDGSELSMVFQFEHMVMDQEPEKEKWDLAPLPFAAWKKVFGKWQQELEGKGWNSLFLNNHDLPRMVSHFGNEEGYRVESAKMLATMLHGMQGTPYIFQGEELGMTNVKFDIEEYSDIETLNMYKERIAEGYAHQDLMQAIYTKGRDNARTPMHWSDEKYAGFSEVQPWIKMNPNYTIINAKSQILDEESVYQYYRKLIRLRKEQDIIVKGSYQPILEENESIFSYKRVLGDKCIVVICNFTSETIKKQEVMNVVEAYKDYEVLLSNYKNPYGSLRPYEARMLKGVL